MTYRLIKEAELEDFMSKDEAKKRIAAAKPYVISVFRHAQDPRSGRGTYGTIVDGGQSYLTLARYIHARRFSVNKPGGSKLFGKADLTTQQRRDLGDRQQQGLIDVVRIKTIQRALLEMNASHEVFRDGTHWVLYESEATQAVMKARERERITRNHDRANTVRSRRGRTSASFA